MSILCSYAIWFSLSKKFVGKDSSDPFVYFTIFKRFSGYKMLFGTNAVAAWQPSHPLVSHLHTLCCCCSLLCSAGSLKWTIHKMSASTQRDADAICSSRCESHLKALCREPCRTFTWADISMTAVYHTAYCWREKGCIVKALIILESRNRRIIWVGRDI